MVKSKSIFGLLILMMVLISGCINSSETIQKNQTINESKIINLDANQLILNDIEMKEVLGDKWKNVHYEEESYTESYDGFYRVVGNGVIVVYDKEPFYDLIMYDMSGGFGRSNFMKPVTIKNVVFTNIEEAKKYYSKDDSIYSQNSNNYHFKHNKIDIGDEGNLYTIEDLHTIKNSEYENIIIKLIFRKNNIVSIILLDTEKSNVLNIETSIELAKKQDEKISTILDIIP